MRDLLFGLLEFRERSLGLYRDRFRELSEEQAPDTLLIACRTAASYAHPVSRQPRRGIVSAIAMPATLAPAAISTAVLYLRVMSNR